jgi:hypothetical protein
MTDGQHYWLTAASYDVGKHGLALPADLIAKAVVRRGVAPPVSAPRLLEIDRVVYSLM